VIHMDPLTIITAMILFGLVVGLWFGNRKLRETEKASQGARRPRRT
jgi:hypothetical protein